MRKLLILWLILINIFLIGCELQQVCVMERANCFQVEIADSEAEILQGLMYREKLAKDRGMLFIQPEEKKQPFWMKNTLIPLDIIWINSAKRIIGIAKNAQPCETDPCPKYQPPNKVKYILEINGGITDEKGIKIGDSVEF